MALAFRVLTGDALTEALDDVARLRIAVFRDWPYLYEGDLAYERRYLAPYAKSDQALIVGAFAEGRLVGAATGAPLSEHAADFAAAFDQSGIDLAQVFYCAESVLLPDWRGSGAGRRFFDLREAHARRLGFRKICFCTVIRDTSHPYCPADYRPLDRFWRRRGYEPLPDVIASFSWKDVGALEETAKSMQFWMRDL